jgi:uncharacterized Zn finger protein
MAHAKLHMICGNCGYNNDFEYVVNLEVDDTLQPFETVYIHCNNCSTVHHLDDNAKQRSDV